MKLKEACDTVVVEMAQQKIVFFEELNSAYDSIFNSYLKKGFLAYCFRIDARYRKKQKIKRYLESKKLVDISSMIFDHTLCRKAAFFAHENVDNIFDKYFSSSPSIDNMANLLDFPEIVDVFKKELLLNLEKLYEIELKINEILKNNLSEDIHFIPQSDFKIHSDESSKLRKDIILINYTNSRIKLKNAFERIFTDDIKSPKKGLLPLFYPIYLFFKKFKGISNNREPKEFKVGITIPRHPKNMFCLNYFTETIYIDDVELPKDKVLFIDENGSKNIAGYRKRGWNFTRILDDREVISSDLFWAKIVRCFLPVWFKTVLFSLLKEPSFIDAKRRILQDYIIWNIFAENYKINNYMRRGLPDSISKTQILSQHGIETFFVFNDNSAPVQNLDWDESMKMHTLFSFMHYDNAIIYGNILERDFKKHRNKISKYIKVGPLYSQIVQELQEGKMNSILPSIISDKKLPNKIIGVFDTSYVDSGPVKVRDGIRFGNDILRLLDDFPDIGIVFLAKKSLDVTPFLTSIYVNLKDHERCVFFARWDKKGISFPEVIASSDLMISAAYTSSTAEALGARKKAIYYDVVGRDIGDKYYFNNYPNFVAHSYEELKKLIKYWLYEVTDDEFNNFLETYVKHEIDPYLDGKGLSRFRKLLMEEEDYAE